VSTVAKLDRNVRLDRMLRKMALRELADDVKVANKKINQGKWLIANAPMSLTEDKKRELHRQMTDVLRFQVISEMTYKHLLKVHRDPKRTGAAKEAIFVRLGAEARA
jgi:hypothetical protein